MRKIVHGRQIECVPTRRNCFGRGERIIDVHLADGIVTQRRLPDHNPRRFVMPRIKTELPKVIYALLARVEQRIRGLLLHHPSQRVEAVRAFLLYALPRMDVLSYRIGKPDRTRPGGFAGFSIDHDIAPGAEMSESRLERAIATVKDLEWLHWYRGDAGDRKTTRGFLRKSAQPIEETADGERRGRAAIRAMTEAFFEAIEFDQVMAQERARLYDRARQNRAKQVDGRARTRRPRTVEALAERLALPDARERPPP